MNIPTIWPPHLRLTRRLVGGLLALSALAAVPRDARASGYFGPEVFLGEGGRLIDATPEFYWELEVKRLARQFTPPEKRVFTPPVKREATVAGEPAEWVEGFAVFTAAQDVAEYAEALRKGLVKPVDPARAAQLHAAARELLTAGKILDGVQVSEEPSEFASYHRGAFAFRSAHFRMARLLWEALLNRPKEERHYRSVWAAYMLGRSYGAEGDASPEGLAKANEWFRRTRELAHEGFADSLGLAAESYGWEAAGEMALGHRRRAAELYLAHLATGNAHAVDGLKDVVPADPDDDWRAAATDPLLRKLTSMHLLAYGRWSQKPEEARAANQRWLGLLEELAPHEADGAEYLGWIAYDVGDYELAGRWLRLAKSDAPAALWLQSKLLRRAGKLAEAAQTMLRAWKTLQNPKLYTRWDYPRDLMAEGDEPERDPAYFSRYTSNEITTFSQLAGGDYGALRLSRGEFIPALEAFRKAGLWFDAAYIAEEILTTNELIKYVDAQPPEPPRLVRVQDERNYEGSERYRSLRHLLGRRLMRDGRFAEALKYLPPPYEKIARRYAEALRDAENLKRSRTERAHAWFRAGWLARYAGMELMGTEGEPDSYATRGDFPADPLAEERTTGRVPATENDQAEAPAVSHKAVLRATGAEVKRLQKTRLEPDVRFRYRLIGVEQMQKAAALLPDNSEDLAEVLNRAGRIAADMDDKVADGVYQQLERRCAKTKLGQAATKVRWFVPESGTWSLEEKAALDELLARMPQPEQ